MANCTQATRTVDPKYGVPASPRVVEEGQPIPRGGGRYHVGRPYTIAGRTYTPQADPANYRAQGIASWYGRAFHGRLTANGEVFDRHAISAAHPTLPIPSYVRVTNLSNKRSLIVRVNDRGPFHGNREIDLSARAADLLGFRDNGIARVQVEYVGRASLAGSDDRKLLASLRNDGRAAPAPVQVASTSSFIPAAAAPQGPTAGPVPTPPGRPFELGRYQSRPTARRPTESRSTLAAAAAPRTEPRAAFVQPAHAGVLTPTPIADQAIAFVTGRGVY